MNFQRYNTSNGLASDEVYDMYQDSLGVMWFATDRGLCSYNGYNFRQYGLADGITSTTILSFFPQSNGDVWCTTMENKLFYFNPKDVVFHPYKFNDQLSEISQGSIFLDLEIKNSGTVRLSFINELGYSAIDEHGKVISKPYRLYDKKANTVDLNVEPAENDPNDEFIYRKECVNCKDSLQNAEKISIPGAIFSRIGVSRIGNTTLVRGNRLCYIIRNGKLINTIIKEKPPVSSGLMDDTHFWVGYRSGGVIVYNLDGNEEGHYLKNKTVSGLLVDHEKSLWISTLSGVYFSSSIKFKSYHLNGEDGVYQLSIDGNGDLGVEMNHGPVFTVSGNKIISGYNKSLFPIMRKYYKGIGYLFRDEYNPYDPNYQDLEIVGDTLFWKRQIMSFSDEPEPPAVVSAGRDFFTIDTGKKIQIYHSKGRINDACTMGGKIYLGKNQGFYAFDPKTKQESLIIPSLSSTRIIDVDRFGTSGVVVGTRGKGVVIHEKGFDLHISSKEGLSSDLVNEVYVENRSTLWVCTNKGLNRVILDGKRISEIRPLTVNDGLIDNDISDVVVHYNIVWVGTRKGLASFNLSDFKQNDGDSELFLRITSIKKNDQPASDISSLRHWENRIEIDFQAISFKNKNLEYRYRLEGLQNPEWHITKIPQVVYEELRPGSYVFLLQVRSNGSWNKKSVRLEFVIHPPFYQSWWFIALLVLFVIVVIYLFFRLRILVYNKDITREILRQLLKRIKTDSNSFVVSANGKSIRINSEDVLFARSHRNYLEIKTKNQRVLVREKISNFLNVVPDPIEYVQVNRSSIVRIDNVTSKSKTMVSVNEEEFKIGTTYSDAVNKIQF